MKAEAGPGGRRSPSPGGKAGSIISYRLIIDITNEQQAVPFSEHDRALMEQAARAACAAAGEARGRAGGANEGAGVAPGGVAGKLADESADICVRLVDLGEMRRLNREFRGVDSATDVLSFPMSGDEVETDPLTGHIVLGDIAISPERARDQADEYGHAYSRELAFLLVHGVLHLLGHDHETPIGEAAMKELQERALAAVGQARGEAAQGTGGAVDGASGGAGPELGGEAAQGVEAGRIAPPPGGGGYRAGFACLAGRSNAGKSTLMNSLAGERLAIVSSKPQTTRKNIKAMLTTEDCQIIFIDTPGAHLPKNKLGEHMMKSVRAAVRDVDLLLLLVDARSRDFDSRERELLKLSAATSVPAVLLVNKADLVQKASLLPLIGRLSAQYRFESVIPISAKTGDGLGLVLEEIRRLLPEGPQLYPADAITDQTERQMAADVVREKALLLLDEEVPHGIEAEVERFAPNERGTALEIYAVLYCERESHKKIIIGKNGESLKRIGAAARLDLERVCGKKVFLSLWVKLKKDWRNDASALRQMGYGRDAGGRE